ncbi:hypothetical protein FOC4_g10004858 [Fusarium odoratissimum]|uniref:HTH OST-type domain-containing protein n=1 Tax=Fusarium oxysporum f. sp. cubense (strain race 4) TaxID=2502994 RepID=N1RX51_FUSC4|nr:hypothetical protein FOC4_g10004858 [Fusarium odoratissimum]
MASIAPAAKLAVLIDADNASAAMIAFVLAEFAKYGTTFVKRAYGDWTSNRLNGWKPQLLQNSIHPMQQFAYTYGKNATDSAMIIDAMDLLYSNKFDGFCIVSSDSDFTRLASRIRESGLVVYGCGERKTPKPFVTACDKFIYVENLVPRSGTPSIEVGVAEPSTTIPLNGVSPSERPPRGHASISAFSKVIEWLREAVEARTGEDGWAGLAPVGMLMNRWHPDFDVRTYGFKKLHELMASTGLFEFMDQRPGEGKPIVKYARYLIDRDNGGSVDSRPTGIVSHDS